MSEPRRILVAIAGAEDPTLVADLSALLGPADPTVEIRLLHVVDPGPRRLLPIGPGTRRGLWPKPPDASNQHRPAPSSWRRDHPAARPTPDQEASVTWRDSSSITPRCRSWWSGGLLDSRPGVGRIRNEPRPVRSPVRSSAAARGPRDRHPSRALRGLGAGAGRGGGCRTLGVPGRPCSPGLGSTPLLTRSV